MLFFVQPKIYFVDEHGIDQRAIDSEALTVLEKLRSAGHTAYLVGGSVRDLLVKKKPKDFDISTSALPEEIKKIFGRQCVIIGRRFRLAHIRFGHKIIEVATFRTGESHSDLIIQDNEWGTPEEDISRRDFTINGMLYDPFSRSIIDYAGGWEDIHKHSLRTIGNPLIRFKQDPVRMLRLLKFRARFGFEIEAESYRALLECKNEITKSSPARLLEEIFRMLESTAAAPFFMLMTESGLLQLLFPPLAYYILGQNGQEVFKYLSLVDKMNKSLKEPLDRSLLVCCLLFPILETELLSHHPNQDKPASIQQILSLTSAVIQAVLITSFSHFPRRISATVGYILTTQFRLTPLSGKRHPRPKLMKMKEFELALLFLKLRATINDQYKSDYTFWRNLHRQNEQRGERQIHHHPAPQAKD